MCKEQALYQTGNSALPDRFLFVKDVIKATGLSRTTLYEWPKVGQFPKARNLGPKRIAWLASEVHAWMQSRPTA